MYNLNRTGRTRSTNIWPGFVDALATLLLVVIFVLMVFVIAQYFLSVALTGKDERLARLEMRISELADLLALEREASAELRISVTQLSSELQASLAARDRLQSRLAAVTEERDDLAGSLRSLQQDRDSLAAQLAALRDERDRLDDEVSAVIDSREALRMRLRTAEDHSARLEAELADAYSTIEADRERIEMQLAEIAILQDLRDQLEAELAERELLLTATREEADALRAELEQIEVDRDTLLAQLLERERAQRELERSLEETRDYAAEQESLTEEARRRIDLLNRQLLQLRRQIAALNEALDAARARDEEQQAQIADLGRRLNVALASRVQELARYRSEFFGRLREILGDNPNIRIVGDRFVFQAEVLFPSGSDALQPEGREQLEALAELLGDLAERIPEDIDWVLRVDGHTDRRPIATARFPSNWELSSARAISVVRLLMDQGIPPNRLVAAGFGEHQPIDPAESEEAFQRNRRIELKLTER